MLTKSQLKSRQRPGNPLKVQVWATGILHTAGYQGEEAVTLRNSKKIRLTPADIIRELHTVAKAFYIDGGIALSEEEIASLKETKETIRRALSELEDDGIALRTDTKGRKLADLKPEELKKLSGKTVMYFWLKPRNPISRTVAEEWAKHQRLTREQNGNAEVANNLLHDIPINHILKIFDFEKLSKKQLSDPQVKAAFGIAFNAAKEAFKRALEVGNNIPLKVDSVCLPVRVDTPGVPEVDTPGGAFERKGESIENHHQEQSAAAPEDLMMMTFERFHFDLCQQFADSRKPTPGEKLSKPIHKALAQDAPQFLQWLTRERLAPVKSAGILPDLLNNFRDAQRAGRKQEEAYQAELRRVAEVIKRKAAEHVEQARKVLANPNEYSAFEIEWANEFLSQQGAA